MFLISGVLISGGHRGGTIFKSVEMYNPATNTTCSLPQLPVERYHHSQDGDLACGGRTYGNTLTTCVKWSSGNWTQTHTLSHKKYSHVSFNTEDGVYLMGGYGSTETTELVKEDGTVEDGFSLKYDTR